MEIIPRLLSTNQCRDYMQMSKKQFYGFAARAGLRRVKPGKRKYYYDRFEIDHIIDRMKIDPGMFPN